MLLDVWIIVAALYLLLFLPAIGYAYGRQRRWHGACGWALLVGGQVFLAAGGGSLFAWGGLLGFFISGCGLLLVLVDLYTRRLRNRT
jgi:thiosulfate reductase cytochrome b subunit